MARTRTSPWEYIHIPTPEQMQLSDIQLKYLMLLNKLERDYGIDYVANIVKSWGKMDWQEKLDRTILLEYELEQGCTCLPDGDACPVCVADNKERYGDSIPYGGE